MRYLKVHQTSMNRALKQSWVLFAFVPNVFCKLRSSWKLGRFMGASWHLKGYELLEFLNKQSSLRKQRIYSVQRNYLAIILLLFWHFIIFSYADRKNPLLMHLIPAVCSEKTTEQKAN